MEVRELLVPTQNGNALSGSRRRGLYRRREMTTLWFSRGPGWDNGQTGSPARKLPGRGKSQGL